VTRTYTPKISEVKRGWVIIDAADVVLGRLASHAATILRGKNKPTFTPHMDMGDFVIIINADKVALTGHKEDELIYWHTGWPGGLRNITKGKLRADDPVKLVEKADIYSIIKFEQDFTFSNIY
jgi:large subunit ribosomal protein L13